MDASALRLIINVDDFGMSKGVNDAVFQLARYSYISSTTVLINGECLEDLTTLASIAHLEIGLHFNLTRGRPISSGSTVASLVDSLGNFHSLPVFLRRLAFFRISLFDIKRELRAQLDKFHELVGRSPSHIDSHQNIHKQPLVAAALMIFLDANEVANLRMPRRHVIRTKSSPTAYRRSPELSTWLRMLFISFLSRLYSIKFFGPIGEIYLTPSKKTGLIKALLSGERPKLTEGVFELAAHPSSDSLEVIGGNESSRTEELFDLIRLGRDSREVKIVSWASLSEFKKI